MPSPTDVLASICLDLDRLVENERRMEMYRKTIEGLVAQDRLERLSPGADILLEGFKSDLPSDVEHLLSNSAFLHLSPRSIFDGDAGLSRHEGDTMDLENNTQPSGTFELAEESYRDNISQMDEPSLPFFTSFSNVDIPTFPDVFTGAQSPLGSSHSELDDISDVLSFLDVNLLKSPDSRAGAQSPSCSVRSGLDGSDVGMSSFLIDVPNTAVQSPSGSRDAESEDSVVGPSAVHPVSASEWSAESEEPMTPRPSQRNLESPVPAANNPDLECSVIRLDDGGTLRISECEQPPQPESKPKSKPKPRKKLRRQAVQLTLPVTGGRKIPCPIPECEYTSIRRHDVRRHVRSIHTKEKLYPCEWQDCSASYVRSDALRHHIRVNHTEDAAVTAPRPRKAKKSAKGKKSKA